MADLRDAAARAYQLLTLRAAPVTESFAAEAKAFPAVTPTQRFSVFDPEDETRAIDLVERMIEVARSSGPEAALALANAAAAQGEIDLAKYATLVFITHEESARGIPIPSIFEREPEKIGKSEEAESAFEAKAMGCNEANLAYFREDPLLNVHHEHWHIVYPSGGVGSPRKIRSRQGELFVYMHEQMLARYDTERLCVGCPPVVPFADYTAVVADGYDPGPNLSPFYPARVANLTWQPLGTYTPQDHATRRDRLNAAIVAGKFAQGPPKLDANTLGCAVEASIGSPSVSGGASPFVSPTSFYGQLHNMGHGFFAELSGGSGGVMNDTATAVRDPVFWQWHRHIDDFSFKWQETQPPNTFTDAPNVTIPDNGGIFLAFTDQLSAQDAATGLGGANWNNANPAKVTNELTTQLFHTTFNYDDNRPPGIHFSAPLDYIDQREFAFVLRLQNDANAVQDVTVRIFMIANEFLARDDSRRFWIELDKFRQTLKANEKAVIYRPAALSSVIRKPAKKPPEFIPIAPEDENPNLDQNYCDCGWPYNLLIPRGTEEGLPCKLFVMLTKWQSDVPVTSQCGSLSYCGARDKYPDAKSMGFPFDRKLPAGKKLADIVTGSKAIAMRDFTIRHLGSAPAGAAPPVIVSP